MAPRNSKKRHTVAAAVYDGVSVFELAVACEVFGVDRSDVASPWYRFQLCAVESGPIRVKSGLRVDTACGLDELARADTIIIPAWRDENERPPELFLDAVRRAHKRGARIMSVCTGAFVLAHAGLLSGRKATTHWMHAAALAEQFPDIDVDPNVLYVDEGDVLTSAGTAAGIDLCLHVVRLDHGAEVANAVARRMVVPPHRDGGQAQFVEQPVPAESNGNGLDAVLGWALQHLDEPLTVEVLAEQASMSPRTFARRFRAVTGTTPHRWLLGQRLLLAQRLLETTDESVERVASLSGFGAAANLRLHFQRSLATAPLAYRRTFRQQAAS